jgi:hypothetical protein
MIFERLFCAALTLAGLALNESASEVPRGRVWLAWVALLINGDLPTPCPITLRRRRFGPTLADIPRHDEGRVSA